MHANPPTILQTLGEKQSLLLKSLHLVLPNSFSLTGLLPGIAITDGFNRKVQETRQHVAAELPPSKAHFDLIPYTSRPTDAIQQTCSEPHNEHYYFCLATHAQRLLPPEGFVSTR